jgi:hypothetical protein
MRLYQVGEVAPAPDHSEWAAAQLRDEQRAGGRRGRRGARPTSRSCWPRRSWSRVPGRRLRERGDDEITEREVTVLLADFATVWSELFPAEQARIVQLLVERVDVQEDALEVRIRAEGLASLVAELRQGDERTARAA